ncbi:MAG TPA: glycoside hydrolase family 65 protein [Enterococcus columbae]|nr:glycoside hydrolase family 65 protein [Enterococcus columbae]
MQLAVIAIQENQWTVTVPDNQVTVFTGSITENFKNLQALLANASFEGGYITGTEELLVETTFGLMSLAQWISETYNVPFVFGNQETFNQQADKDLFTLTYYGFTPGKDEYSIESLLTVGNGFMGLRGTTPEMEISDDTYPATYLASLYNAATSKVSNHDVVNEDFVNAPNAQKMYLNIDGQKVEMTKDTIHYFKRQLNLKNGLFTAKAIIAIDDKQIECRTEKFVSMENIHEYYLRYSFTPLNFSGEVTFVSEMDGSVYNYNVARYRSLNREHLDVMETKAQEQQALLIARTKQSKITVTQASQLTSECDLAQLVNETNDTHVYQKLTIAANQNETYQFTKAVAIYQDRENEATTVIDLDVLTFDTFEEALEKSGKAWQKLWDKAAITIHGDYMSQRMLHLHTFHILASASPNGNKGLDASVTARGLHGEAYRGHIFWDELFILPFYIVHFPETARELLMYRYRRLAAAKKDAQKEGLKGAMFPWQAGLYGDEQSQFLHLNPISGEWKEDHSRRQRHVSLAIAYNVWQYFNNTQDLEFMEKYGLELMLEIAHFWESIAFWDESLNRYSIEGVMGPDEFHESYPGAEKGGLKNNAYTNMMVVWLFEQIHSLQQQLPATIFNKVQEKTGVSDELIQHMGEIRHQLALEIDQDGIIAQYQDYFKLKEVDWDYYREKYGNIYRMDRILNAEGKSADSYKVAKQADSLMIYYNFSKETVDNILKDLDYQVPSDYVKRNLDYYLARTSHGSTLSRIVHAQLGAMIGENELAWKLYQEALNSDYRDIQGGTTAEGIHAGVMAATLFIPLTTFAGMDIRLSQLHFNPNLPVQWEDIAFNITIRNVDYQVFVNKEQISLTASQDSQCYVGKQLVTLPKNQKVTVNY